MTAPRIVVVLHPNPSRIDIVLNDRMFNKERYAFSRDQEPVGNEKVLLDILNNCIIGIDAAKAAKNTLQLEIGDGMLHREFMPQVIMAVKEWAADREYKPMIYCDDRGYDVEPEYSYTEDDYSVISPGVKRPKNAVDLGVTYEVWTDR